MNIINNFIDTVKSLQHYAMSSQSLHCKLAHPVNYDEHLLSNICIIRSHGFLRFSSSRTGTSCWPLIQHIISIDMVHYGSTDPATWNFIIWKNTLSNYDDKIISRFREVGKTELFNTILLLLENSSLSLSLCIRF